jgi:hypothetical protein
MIRRAGKKISKNKKPKSKSSGWGDKIKPIPVSGAKHPDYPSDAKYMPPHEFIWGMIGPPGRGKTTVLCNALMMTKGYYHNIIIVSPSVEADEKWSFIKKQKLLRQNTPLLKWMKEQEKKESKSQVVEDAPKGFDMLKNGIISKGTEEKEQFDPRIPEECFYKKMDMSQLQEIMDEQEAIVIMLEEHGLTKHLANRILFIWDDMVGSNLFTMSRKNNKFLELMVRHRHFSSSHIICTQGYKEIPKTDRTCYANGAVCIFDIPNFKELEAIYEEYSQNLSRESWQEMYEFATKEKHDFLYMNLTADRGSQCMKNMKEFLFFAEDIAEDRGGVKKRKADKDQPLPKTKKIKS